MEIEVEIEKGSEFIVLCPRHKGDNCPICDGEGTIKAKTAEKQVVYEEIDEGELIADMEPSRHTRSI